MTSGRGGECASMSATGVRCAQRRERPRWDADARIRDRHLRQTCTSLYHQHSRRHSPPCRMRTSLVSSSSKRSGRYRRNMLISESSSRTSMDVTLLAVVCGRFWAINIEGSVPPTLESITRYALGDSFGEIKAMDGRQYMRHVWGVATV